MNIIIIAALAKNNVIGKKGDIPWRIRDDFKRFKELTLGHPCIMGDKTYESLPANAKPLPGRENIILTFDKQYNPAGTTVFYSFDDAINYCKEKKYDKVFICGGGFVYKQALAFADSLELTRIHKDVDGDILFPQINFDDWTLVNEKRHVDQVMGDYSFMSYARKNKIHSGSSNSGEQIKKGKLIVICGTDGSGKGTQVKLLSDRLEKEGYKVKVTDFPQYGQPSAGMVSEYLNGKFGTANEVGPYRASIFYACDRYAASFEMKKWLDDGGIIISNRYVSANKGHQLGKIKDKAERDNYLAWLDNLEYGIFGIPKEDINFLLFVPPEIGQRLVDKKDTRSYTEKKRDIHEADLQHLKDAADAYMYVAKKEDWEIIDCTKDENILPINTIHQMVYDKVKKSLELQSKKTIYLSHSMDFDFKKELYEPLKASSFSTKYTFIFPHENTSVLFDSKTVLQKKDTIMIVDVSSPKLGVGWEIGWADAFGARIIAIYKRGTKLSNSVQEKIKEIIEYDSSSDLIEKLEKIL